MYSALIILWVPNILVHMHRLFFNSILALATVISYKGYLLLVDYLGLNIKFEFALLDIYRVSNKDIIYICR